ncbi:MAG: hypothetical protein AAF682_09075 [Planctomycetota bacterium]
MISCIVAAALLQPYHPPAPAAWPAVGRAAQEGQGRQGTPPKKKKGKGKKKKQGKGQGGKDAKGQDDEEAPPPKPRSEVASERLRDVELDLGAVLIERHPSLARRRGLPPADEKPLEIGNQTGLAWQSTLERSAAELAMVPWEDLEPLRRLDFEWIRAWIRAEDRLDSLVPAERWSPDRYLREMLDLLRGLVDAPDLAPPRRMALVTAHLRTIPKFLLQAKESLVFPTPQASAYAALLAGELEFMLTAELIPALEERGPPAEAWRALEDANDDAVLAIGAFRTWLGSVAAQDEGTRVLGSKGWHRLVSELSGSELELAPLKIRLLRDIAALDTSLGRYRQAPPPKPEQLTEAALCRVQDETLTQAWELLIALAIVEGEEPQVSCRERVSYSFPAPIVAMRGGMEAGLVFSYRGLGWARGVQASRFARMGVPNQRALLLQYGFPGEALWEHWSRTSERLAQRTAWNRCQREAWGLYAADWVVRAKPTINPFAGDEALAAEIRRNRLFEAARMYAALLLHTDRREEQDVVEEFRLLTSVDAETAAFEVRTALIDPLHGAGYLGYIELRELESEVRGLFNSVEALRRTARLVMVSPSAPSPALLDYVTIADEAKRAKARKGKSGESGDAGRASGDSTEKAE